MQDAAAAAGLAFPLSLASEGSCTIGGNLSTNAGGTAVLRYGNTRDLTLGVEAVLADGSVFDGLRGLRKDNTGYDLKQLFIGAEGTLGIVTAAVLKLFPAPRTRRHRARRDCRRSRPPSRLLHELKGALSDRLTGFELMSAFSLALSRKHHPGAPDPLPGHPWYVLVQADDSAPESRRCRRSWRPRWPRRSTAGIAADAVVAQSAEQAASDCGRCARTSAKRSGAKVPTSSTTSRCRCRPIPAFMRRVRRRARRRAFPGARLVVFGHLGDGNLHYNLSAPEGVDAARFHGQCRARQPHRPRPGRRGSGGSFSAEHGVGQLKRDDLVRYKSAVEVRLMRAVKAALDPRGLMNPGKVL